MFKSKIIITADSKLTNAIKEALEPEKDFRSERANYNLSLKNKELSVQITAQDATAFRAVMNSVTGSIAVIERTWKEIENEKGKRRK